MERALSHHLPDTAVRIIMKEVHKIHMKEICRCINHNLVWVRYTNKKTKQYSYSFLIGEEREKKADMFWDIADDAPCIFFRKYKTYGRY